MLRGQVERLAEGLPGYIVHLLHEVEPSKGLALLQLPGAIPTVAVKQICSYSTPLDNGEEGAPVNPMHFLTKPSQAQAFSSSPLQDNRLRLLSLLHLRNKFNIPEQGQQLMGTAWICQEGTGGGWMVWAKT